MAYYKPTYKKKCTLVLLDELNRPIIQTAKKMFGINEANAHGDLYILDYNKKKSATDPKAVKWDVIV